MAKKLFLAKEVCMKKVVVTLLLCLLPLFVHAADNTKAVSVATTATQIVGVTQNREILIIYNNGTADVFIGFDATDTTTASSLVLEPGVYMKFTKKADAVYGIVASGTVEVRVWEDQGR